MSLSPRTQWPNRLKQWLGQSEPVARPGPVPDSRWEQRFFSQMRDFVGAVLRQPSRPDVRAARQRRERSSLPFDLYLALGQRSLPLFTAGPVDEFAFFQRRNVSACHDIEFLTRLSRANRGTESFRPYGVIRLRAGRELPVLASSDLVREALDQSGLPRLPQAQTLAVRRFSAYDMHSESNPRSGRNRVAAPRSSKVFARRGMTRFFYSDALDIMRRELSDAEKIAWIEEAFTERPCVGEIVHRYYMGSSSAVYLVRDHWGRGKRLYRAETSAAARRACVDSGAFKRLRFAA
jgi:hypothetical protein